MLVLLNFPHTYTHTESEELPAPVFCMFFNFKTNMVTKFFISASKTLELVCHGIFVFGIYYWVFKKSLRSESFFSSSCTENHTSNLCILKKLEEYESRIRESVLWDRYFVFCKTPSTPVRYCSNTVNPIKYFLQGDFSWTTLYICLCYGVSLKTHGDWLWMW